MREPWRIGQTVKVRDSLWSPSGRAGLPGGIVSSSMASSKRPDGLDLVAGAMTAVIAIVLAMAFGFLIIVAKAFIHTARRWFADD